MGLFDDIKTKADLNGDGKITKEDLESLKDGKNNGIVAKLEAIADQNDDGKLNLDDVKNFSLKDSVNDIKNNLF